jgi:hypothetical protein
MAEDITGTEGYTNGPIQKPSDNDVGNDVFNVLETFMDRLATHSHSGADSQKITLNIEKDFTTFTVGVDLFWTDLGNDVYRGQLTVPAGADVDNNIRRFYYNDGTTWREFFPTVEKIDSTNYYIYSNDNTINVRVVTL